MGCRAGCGPGGEGSPRTTEPRRDPCGARVLAGRPTGTAHARAGMTVVGRAASMPRRLQAERPAVSVDELKRAWAAVQEGHFRPRPTTMSDALGASRCVADMASSDLTSHSTIADPGHGWTPEPDERVLRLLGCAGSAGTTTVALAVAL